MQLEKKLKNVNGSINTCCIKLLYCF